MGYEALCSEKQEIHFIREILSRLKFIKPFMATDDL